ncbi:MAG: hypothetical protein FWH03_04065 [Firmicutes bacterium]|nr:hypothetical protein [Bacillota bacterium]
MPNLKPLLDYQNLDIELKRIHLEIERHPDAARLKKTKSEFSAAKTSVSDSEESAGHILSFLQNAQKFYEEAETKTAELLASLETLPEDDVDGRRSILSQLESLRDRLANLEKRVGDRRKKSESAVRTYREAQEKGKKMKNAYAQVKERLDAFCKVQEPKINQLTQQLDAARAAVDPALMERYTALAADNKYPPLVEARSSDGGKTFNCLGCGLSLSQSAKSALTESGFCACETCRRMIYKA